MSKVLMRFFVFLFLFLVVMSGVFGYSGGVSSYCSVDGSSSYNKYENYGTTSEDSDLKSDSQESLQGESASVSGTLAKYTKLHLLNTELGWVNGKVNGIDFALSSGINLFGYTEEDLEEAKEEQAKLTEEIESLKSKSVAELDAEFETQDNVDDGLLTEGDDPFDDIDEELDKKIYDYLNAETGSEEETKLAEEIKGLVNKKAEVEENLNSDYPVTAIADSSTSTIDGRDSGYAYERTLEMKATVDAARGVLEELEQSGATEAEIEDAKTILETLEADYETQLGQTAASDNRIQDLQKMYEIDQELEEAKAQLATEKGKNAAATQARIDRLEAEKKKILAESGEAEEEPVDGGDGKTSSESQETISQEQEEINNMMKTLGTKGKSYSELREEYTDFMSRASRGGETVQKAYEQALEDAKNSCVGEVGKCSEKEMDMIREDYDGEGYTSSAIDNYADKVVLAETLKVVACEEDSSTEECKQRTKAASEASKYISELSSEERISYLNANIDSQSDCSEEEAICDEIARNTLENQRDADCASQYTGYMKDVCQYTNFKNERQLATEYVTEAVNSYYNDWKKKYGESTMTTSEYNSMIGDVVVNNVFGENGGVSYNSETNTYSIDKNSELGNLVNNYNTNLANTKAEYLKTAETWQKVVDGNQKEIDDFIDENSDEWKNYGYKEGMTTEEILELDGLSEEDRQKLAEMVDKKEKNEEYLNNVKAKIEEIDSDEINTEGMTLEQLRDVVDDKYDSCSEQEDVDACESKWGTVRSELDVLYDKEGVDTGIGYAVLDALRNPDQDALNAAKFFGFEADYTSLPKWLGNDIASSICLGKIDGYLDKEFESDGGVTQYGDGGSDNELEVKVDLRGKRTRMTPDGKLLVSYSYYINAIDQDVQFTIDLQYTKGGTVKSEPIVENGSISSGGTDSGMDQIQLTFEEDEMDSVNEDSFELYLDAGGYTTATAKVVLVGEGDDGESDAITNSPTAVGTSS